MSILTTSAGTDAGKCKLLLLLLLLRQLSVMYNWRLIPELQQSYLENSAF